MIQARNLTNATNIEIAKYKNRTNIEIEDSRIHFEQNKTDEQCTIEGAIMKRPCECGEGKRLVRVEWTQKPSIATGKR